MNNLFLALKVSVLGFIFATLEIDASPQCMERQHSSPAIASYENLSCSCQCERYERLFEQGRCSRCLHVCVPKALPLKS
jgi:hypothetical protein